ncbi:MAG: MoxR family ATPase [Oscillospiraceae bacterium]|nr:MoxR family ATPase [Oscillospiraceae bacterium]
MENRGEAGVLSAVKENIEKVIVGKSDVIDLMLICFICGGHVLIEDVPGLGKTTLAAALAQSVNCSFRRIQFTPDILPSDITGFTMFHMKTGDREFHEGAIMSQIVLADEINRTSPKTQSALLQAMQEGRVTVDGDTYILPKPFMVCATQNPVELTGTYPLPEAQLDRFFMRVAMGYPDKNDEIAILERGGARAADTLTPVADADDILALQEKLESVQCARSIMAYIVDVCRRTRESKEVALGVSPRGAIALMRASMGYALLSGRDYVLPDDVQKMAAPVLCHRIIMRAQAYIQNQTPETVLEDVLRFAPVPAMQD